jgi:anti-sigma regulatory factor (Ser/Thr protein kinase)
VCPDSRTSVDTRSTDRLTVRLTADPASVPGARRFVEEGLRAWGHDVLVDDATLCVSELAGNAALHSESTYMEVTLVELEDAVRVCVEDDGSTPPEAIAPRQEFRESDAEDTEEFLALEPTTGRGLAIVSILACDWGVETTEDGTLVWAELTPSDCDSDGDADVAETGVVVQPQRTDARLDHGQPEDDPQHLPEGWVRVTLPGCPVDLGLQHDQHLDELVRELQLMGSEPDGSESRELADHLHAILTSPAHARSSLRRQMEEAQQANRSHVDVEMAMPREFSPLAVELSRALARADRLCAERRLLTVESGPELRLLREWMTGQLVGQIEDDASPEAWDDWRARHA